MIWSWKYHDEASELPVSLAAFKAYIATDPVLDAQLQPIKDEELNIHIEAATQWAMEFTNRQIVSSSFRLYLDDFHGADAILLPRGPVLTAVAGILYYDSTGTQQTWSTSNFVVDITTGPPRIYPAYNVSWPSVRTNPAAIEIQFDAGYGATDTAIPRRIKQAIMTLAQRLSGVHKPDQEEALQKAAEMLLWPLRNFYDTPWWYACGAR